MSENTKDTTPDSDPLDHLSDRVNQALEQDAHRRRWARRVFVSLAVIPAIAAALILYFGQSEVEQAERLVQRESGKLEARVSEQVAEKVTAKVTESVAREFAGAREVGLLLPELKQVVKAVPQVQENQRTLSEHQMRVDSVVQRQDDLAHSIAATSSSLAKIPARVDSVVERQDDLARSIAATSGSLAELPEQLRGLESRIQATARRTEAAESRANIALHRVDVTARDLGQRIKMSEGKIAHVERMDESIHAIRGEMHDTRRDINRQIKKRFAALSAPLSDVRRIGGIVNSMSSISGSMERLESKMAKLPSKVTNTTKLQRSIKNLLRSVKAINGKIEDMKRSIAKIDKRLKKLEPPRVMMEGVMVAPGGRTPRVVNPRVK